MGVRLYTKMIKGLAKIIAYCYKSGGKVLICGNGGLAAESEHFAAELMSKFAFDIYVPCIALTTNSVLITAISHDMGFENVFSHQIETLAQPGDILIAMTTSASPNILKAIEAGKNNGMITFLLDRSVWAGNDTAEIQNNAIRMLHQLAYEIKRELNEHS